MAQLLIVLLEMERRPRGFEWISPAVATRKHCMLWYPFAEIWQMAIIGLHFVPCVPSWKHRCEVCMPCTCPQTGKFSVEVFPSTLVAMALSIEKRQPKVAPMFSHQLLKRRDPEGRSVDRLANVWAHTDVSLIRPYSKPGVLEQCCALWTAENFLAFAQAACFGLDPLLTPASPYSAKYY